MIKVRVDNIQVAGMAKFWEISWRVVPEIPHITEASPAQPIPFMTACDDLYSIILFPFQTLFAQLVDWDLGPLLSLALVAGGAFLLPPPLLKLTLVLLDIMAGS